MECLFSLDGNVPRNLRVRSANHDIKQVVKGVWWLCNQYSENGIKLLGQDHSERGSGRIDCNTFHWAAADHMRIVEYRIAIEWGIKCIRCLLDLKTIQECNIATLHKTILLAWPHGFCLLSQASKPMLAYMGCTVPDIHLAWQKG